MEIYARSREQLLIPLKDAGGKVYRLSPGKHNRLQVAVVEEFGPRFALGARLLYLGDTSNKMLIWDPKQFQRIGLALTEHDKLPDVVL